MISILRWLEDKREIFKGKSEFTWIIDNPHGRFSGGEWEWNRLVAKEVCDSLRAENISHLQLVPEEDVDDCLRLRLSRAKIKGKSIYVAINGNRSFRGVEVWYRDGYRQKYIASVFQYELSKDFVDRGIKIAKNFFLLDRLDLGVHIEVFGGLDDAHARKKVVKRIVDSILYIEKNMIA